MGVSLTAFVNSDTVTAAIIQARMETIEAFINGGMVTADLDTSPKPIQTRHLFAPEFKGSPAPRTLLISGDCHYRYTGFDRWERAIHHQDSGALTRICVSGLQATFHTPSGTTYADILTSFYAWESGATNASPVDSALCATFDVHIDDVAQTASERSLFDAGTGTYKFARKQHSIARHASFTQGIHTVGVRVYIEVSTFGSRLWKHIFIQGRSLVVDLETK